MCLVRFHMSEINIALKIVSGKNIDWLYYIELYKNLRNCNLVPRKNVFLLVNSILNFL